MAAESKTGCFLKFLKKFFSGRAPPPPPDGRAFCCPHDAYGQVEK